MGRKKKKEWQKKGWSKPGRKLGQLSGNKSQLKPGEQSARERVARLAEGSPEWNLLRLVKLIEAEKKNLLADKEVMLHPGFPRGFLAMIRNAVESHQRAQPKPWSPDPYPLQADRKTKRKWAEKQAAHRQKLAEEQRRWKKSGPSALVREIYDLVRDLHAELDSALETGDIDRWLKNKAEAMRAKQRAPDRFEAAFVQALEENRDADEMSLAEAKKHAGEHWKKKRLRQGIVTPRPRTTATRVNFTGAQQVLDKLRAETVTRPETIDGRKGKFITPSKQTYVRICDREFADMRRARDAGDKIAKRHGYEWKTASNG